MKRSGLALLPGHTIATNEPYQPYEIAMLFFEQCSQKAGISMLVHPDQGPQEKETQATTWIKGYKHPRALLL